MNDKDQKSVKSVIYDVFSYEYVNNIGKLLHQMAERFVETQPFGEKVFLDEVIFKYCLLDMFVDLARLKSFHDIELLNYIKIISYASSWCLKRKPFQRAEDCGKDNLYVNERFVLSMLLDAAGAMDGNAKYAKVDGTDIEKDMEQLYYHLKYRNTNPQTLELYLTGLHTGKAFYHV